MWDYTGTWRLLHKTIGWHFVWVAGRVSRPGIESGMFIGYPEYGSPSVSRVVFLDGKPTFDDGGNRVTIDPNERDRYRPLTFSFDEDGNPVANKSLHL